MQATNSKPDSLFTYLMCFFNNYISSNVPLPLTLKINIPLHHPFWSWRKIKMRVSCNASNDKETWGHWETCYYTNVSADPFVVNLLHVWTKLARNVAIRSLFVWLRVFEQSYKWVVMVNGWWGQRETLVRVVQAGAGKLLNIHKLCNLFSTAVHLRRSETTIELHHVVLHRFKSLLWPRQQTCSSKCTKKHVLYAFYILHHPLHHLVGVMCILRTIHMPPYSFTAHFPNHLRKWFEDKKNKKHLWL